MVLVWLFFNQFAQVAIKWGQGIGNGPVEWLCAMVMGEQAQPYS